MQLWQCCLLVTEKITLHVSDAFWVHHQEYYVEAATGACHGSQIGYDIVQWQTTSDIFPTHGKHQWLFLQLLIPLIMDAESVRNMKSNFAVTNKQHCQSCI